MNPLESFSKGELERYSRHLILPEFGIEGQRKLKFSRVLVVGSGGLGAPILLYLAAAGIGEIGIIDFDNVELSNLQRQVMFGIDDIGMSKVRKAAEKLNGLNPDIVIKPIEVHLDSSNALEILKDYDVIIDGTDNFPTRYLVNDACVLLGKPLIYGSIFRFEGQVSVFNFEGGPNYRDLFPTPPPPDMVPNCAEGGVLGVLPGIIGSLQANEAIKIITGIGESLSGKLLVFDAAYLEFRKLSVPNRKSAATIKELIDYDEFCMINAPEKESVPTISVSEFADMKEDGKYQLIDVREPYEYEICEIGGLLIPKNDVDQRLSEIKSDIPVVVHCRTGKRSGEVVSKLLKLGFQNVLNLDGGILQWIEEQDPELQRY